MSQNINAISNGTHLSIRQNTNKALESLSCNYYGPTDPATITGMVVYPGFTWADSLHDRFKQRNLANDDWNSLWVLSTGKWLGNVASADSVGDIKIVKSGYLSNANSQDIITVGAYTVPSNRRLICKVTALDDFDFPLSNVSKTLKSLGYNPGGESISTGMYCSCTLNLTSGTYANVNAIVSHYFVAAYGYTDGTNENTTVKLPCLYEVMEIPA